MPKSPRRKRRAPETARAAAPAESPVSQGVTVFWMTSLLATVVGEVVAVVLRLALWLGGPPELARYSSLMLFVAVATGLVCLGLTPIVLRWRDTPPPVAVTRFSVAVSLLPLLLLVVLALAGG